MTSEEDNNDDGMRASFERATELVASGEAGNPTQAERLELYGLYSVVRNGKPPVRGPSAYLDPVGFAKWTAWTAMSDMSADEARRRYAAAVAALQQKSGGTEAERSSNGGEGYGGEGISFGSKASTGFIIGDRGCDDKSEGKDDDVWSWAAAGDATQVTRCVRWGRTPVDARDADGLTPLMRAADRDAVDVLDVLLAAGADVSLRDADGQTALHYAVCCGHTQAAGILVTHGAPLHVADKDGFTPLQVATGDTLLAIEQARTDNFQRLNPSTMPAYMPLTRLAQHVAPRLLAVCASRSTLVLTVTLACAVAFASNAIARWYQPASSFTT